MGRSSWNSGTQVSRMWKIFSSKEEGPTGWQYTFNLDLVLREINELDFMTLPVKDASDFGVHACPLAE